jgi:dTDP-4-dehydrorhamnose reductase
MGAAGMLGRDCGTALDGPWRLVTLTRDQLDVTAAVARMSAILGPLRPDVIVNCTGFTDVDGTEENMAEAEAVNAAGLGRLAEAARGLGARLVHFSTDYVFDGAKPPPESYGEEDAPAPVNAYGLTKWRGEQAVRATLEEHLIVRTAWLYGRHGNSFPKAVLRQALAGRDLRVVDDQFGSPTWSLTLVRQVRALIEAGVTGTVHATARGHCTWFEFAQAFLRLMGIEARLARCASAQYPRPARRPANSILENRRLGALGLDLMPPWEEDLARFVAQHGADLRREGLPI